MKKSTLQTGITSIRANVTALMNDPVQSVARNKAIMTISKKHNITYQEAQFRQAQRIAQSLARKK